MQLIRRPERWDPFRDMEEFSNRLNQFFGLSKPSGDGERELMSVTDWAPSCDIKETEKEYRILAELPGVTKGDVHVTLEEGVVTIQGERREEKEEKDAKRHRRELSYGKFLRRFSMPDDADESKVDASFKDGILNVVIAKSKSKPNRTKEIAVH